MPRKTRSSKVENFTPKTKRKTSIKNETAKVTIKCGVKKRAAAKQQTKVETKIEKHPSKKIKMENEAKGVVTKPKQFLKQKLKTERESQQILASKIRARYDAKLDDDIRKLYAKIAKNMQPKLQS